METGRERRKNGRKSAAGGVHRRVVYAVAAVLFLVTLLWKTESVMRGESTRICQVYCLGDSITYGSGLPEELRAQYCYPAQLKDLLGAHYEVMNYGVRGRTLMDVPNRAYRETGYLDVLKVQPADIVIVMLGTNDSKAGVWDAKKYREEYEALLGELEGLDGAPQIYLMTPPKAYPGADGTILYGISNDVIRDEIRGIVCEIADEKHTGLIDLYAVTEGHPEYFEDGVHPNQEGYGVLAQEIWAQLTADGWTL